jgi:hypothetical protein
MKNLIIAIALLFTTCFTHAGGGSITTTPVKVVDAELAASAFLVGAADYYHGSSYLEQTAVNGTYTWVQSDFTLRGGKITKMTVYSAANPKGTEITVPKGGFPGFPRNTVGQTRNFSLNLQGYDAGGQFVTYGYFGSQLLKSSDQIVVTLSPGSRLAKISFPRSTIPAGVDPNNLSLQYGNSWASWNSYLEAFWVYVDPLADAQWVLIDRSTGFVYPFDPANANVTSAYAGIGIKYIGGASKINWIDTVAYFTGQFLDCIVSRADQMVAAKTYFTDLNGDGMTIFASDLNGTVEIFSVDPDGKKTLVKSAVVVAADWNNIWIDAGYDKVVITFTGTVTYTGGFQVQFYRQSQNGTSVYGGG